MATLADYYHLGAYLMPVHPPPHDALRRALSVSGGGVDAIAAARNKHIQHLLDGARRVPPKECRTEG
jgi:hypothetical protein